MTITNVVSGFRGAGIYPIILDNFPTNGVPDPPSDAVLSEENPLSCAQGDVSLTIVFPLWKQLNCMY